MLHAVAEVAVQAVERIVDVPVAGSINTAARANRTARGFSCVRAGNGT
jgi:hypothetical protein